MPVNAIPNVNCLWGDVVAGTLARLGLRQAVIAPGSRSAPLVWGLTRQKGIEAIPVLDERSAGFYALGLAKASRRPVALVCTSGTAAANFFPAVIEASESAVPLLVLTADRPPELRDCAAGQAIDQVKLYGGFVRWQHEVALPENRPEMLRYLQQTLGQAWDLTYSPWAGPVHLNFPFREPLAPVFDEAFVPAALDASWLKTQPHGPWRSQAGSYLRDGEMEVKEYCKVSRAVFVVGETLDDDAESFSAELASVSDKLGWPVLADGLFPGQHEGNPPQMRVSHFDIILREGSLHTQLQPELVVQIGCLPTSKILRAWLAKMNLPTVIVQRGMKNVDPLHRETIRVNASAGQFLKELAEHDLVPPADLIFSGAWLACERQAKQAVAEWFETLDWLFEGKAAWLLSRTLPPGTRVFAASSMPIRDCASFWAPESRHVFYYNRGANGIDGTLSTALGVAHETKKPTVLYTGDLALLHDQNGFLAAKELPEGASLTIVVINNDGSGIFEHLPMAEFDPPFERYFATPQGVDFAKLADLHGAEYHCPKSWAAFEEAVRTLPARGLRLVELRTDRKRDAAFRKKLFEKISKGLKQ